MTGDLLGSLLLSDRCVGTVACVCVLGGVSHNWCSGRRDLLAAVYLTARVSSQSRSSRRCCLIV